MTRSSTRYLSAARFLFRTGLALAFMLLITNVALAEGETAPPPSKDKLGGLQLILFMANALGCCFGPLLGGVSVAMMALIVLLALDLRMSAAIPAGFVDEFTDIVNKRRFKEAFDMARNDASFLGQVLTAGMSRLQYGLEDAREAAMNTLESIKSRKDQKNNYTAVIATLGPMFGLVGTVFGMIQSFSVLAQPGKQVDPAQLADGISHALVVTLVGVAISVPAIFFNAFYRNRITRVCMDVGHIADDLLTQMYHNSKKTPTATPSAASAPNSPTPPAR